MSRPASAPPPRSRLAFRLPSLGLTGRVFLGTAAIITVVLVAALVVASVSVRRGADAAVRRGLDQAADLVAQFLAGRERSLGGGARVFVQGPYFRALVAERRRDDILDQSFEAADQLDADWVFITDERGVMIAKSDEPGAWGEPMGDVPLIAGALQGRVTSGYGVSRDTLLFQAIAVPIVVPGGAPVGTLVATRIVDSLIARDVESATAGQVIFYTLDMAGQPRIAASTLGRGDDVEAALIGIVESPAEPGAQRPPVVIGGRTYAAQGSALTTAGGEVVGGFAVLRSRDAALSGIDGVRRSLLAAGALGLVLALAAAYAAAHRVTRPVRALADAAHRAADGDYSDALEEEAAVEGAERGGRRDEIHALAAAFRGLLADLRDKQALVAALSAEASAPVATQAGPPHPTPAPALAVVRSHAGSARGGAAPAPRIDPRITEAEPVRARAGVALVPGDVLAGRFAVQSEIGAGGMGIVYRAVDRTLGETVALKMLRPEAVAVDPQARERFKDEIRLARRVSQRNVVRTHDMGESDGVPFITMEYVEGSSLATVLRTRGALPRPAVLSIAKQLCRAMRAAHEQGVVHGDLKPQNLLIGPDGVLKVTDFGVARLVRRPASGTEGAGEPASPFSSVGATRLVGAIVGTPEYMAPEQLLGEEPDTRADMYAAGIVLHECITGATPFQADTPLGFFARKLEAAPASRAAPATAAPRGASQRDTSPRDARPTTLDAVIARMTAHDPDERPSFEQLHDVLGRLS